MRTLMNLPLTASGRAFASRHVPSERGSVLVVSLLVILAMTGLGVVAFQSAVASTRTASSFSLSKQANFVTELGMVAGFEQLRCSYGARDVAARQQALSADGPNLVGDWHSSDLFCGEAPLFFSSEPFGEREAHPEFIVIFRDGTLGRRAAGYDESRACFLRFELESIGQVRMDPRATSVGGDVPLPTLIRRRAIGYAYIGPIVSDVCNTQQGGS